MRTPDEYAKTARDSAHRALMAHDAFIWLVAKMDDAAPETWVGMASPQGSPADVARAIGSGIAALTRMAQGMAETFDDPKNGVAFLRLAFRTAEEYTPPSALASSQGVFITQPVKKGDEPDGTPH